MGIKSFLAQPFAAFTTRRLENYHRQAVALQHEVLEDITDSARDTQFGKDHNFRHIRTYKDFKRQVPIRDYEALKPYIEMMLNGEADILWEDRPLYFAKTSGTTSGTKYIPISRDSISNHINGARNALLAQVHRVGSDFINGKMIFLSGSPVLHAVADIPTGRLSGIVNHHIPAYLRRNQLPSYPTNCIEDWELKLDAIVQETLHQDMRLISGIPPWVQMYFDRLHEVSNGKRIKDIFPNLSVIVHGGVNFQPYRAKMQESIGGKVSYIETYPASEGFIAYQDSQQEESLLLNIYSGIFFEFVPADEIFNENPTRLHLGEVEIGVNYALILSSNAGLWAYNIGDTVKFVSKNPYRIVVTGRTKHFISAFGEHVIAEEVESALASTAAQHQVRITEFTVAPQVQSSNSELPHHEWWIEFDTPPAQTAAFAADLDAALMRRNIYYRDLIEGRILQPLKIKAVRKGFFQDYMKSIGKLGGQNKVPHLSNDRNIASALERL
ncbi:MAG: GH3 auxin-responsive promoter family protein [Sphingobacteriales bacterium]|nr:GH3 auxin-responsive promoter family protein [Sphingobacteriales bacterium]